MARIITKELALKIASKLKAQKSSKKGRPHDDYPVFYNGRLVAKFSVRHGSGKDQGHDFVSHAFHLPPREAKLFGQCHMKYDEWVEKMRQKRIIEDE
jgi:hypothetical protein